MPGSKAMPMWFPLALTLSLGGILSGECRMTNELREEALNAHNYLRQNVYPEAVGMTRLTWSRELEALAEKAASTCKFEHNTAPEFAGKGENMYLGSKGNFTEILTMMFLERELYDFDNARCLAGTDTGSPYSFFSTCGHYLQIVRSDMTQVGCSIKDCPGGYNLAVCEYESLYKDPPYRARKPGEDPCELCGFGGYATACDDDGMCVLFDPEKPARRSGVMRKCLNCGKMQYYGTFDYCMCESNFYGDVCEYSLQKTPPRSFLASCNKCKRESIQCQNGASEAAANDDTCQCICRGGFTGQYCEINIEEDANTLRLYIGGNKRYFSYYPVSESNWRAVSHEVTSELSNALSNYCTTGRPQVKLSGGYPATTKNGSLKIGLHATCGHQYMPKAELSAALISSEKQIAATLRRVGNSLVAME